MQTAFYITSYNDPESCKSLLTQLESQALPERYDCFLSDQSDDQHAPCYARLAARFGFQHVRNVNQGASAAKRRIVQHARENGYEYMAQISEDFAVLDSSTCQPWLAPGTATFLDDAMHLLLRRPELAAVFWTFSMCRDGSHLWLWSRERDTTLLLDRLPGMTLAYAYGEIALSNWPYTGRVQHIAQAWERALAFQPVSDRQKELHAGSGGEFALSLVTLGQAAVLLANPVGHARYHRPPGSLP